MPDIDYQPRLSWWSHAWRYAVVILISAVSWSEVAQWQWQHARWWFWADLALGIAGLVLLGWRRRHPVTVAVAVNALSLVSWSSGGPATLALVSMATRRQWREIVPVGVMSLTVGVILESTNPVSDEPYLFTVPVMVLVIGVTVGWGLYIGSRRELLSTLRERAESAEADQASRVSQARTAERARIAREMHDVLAHRISLVTMHAGALAYRKDLDADDMRVTAEVIQESSHQAMIELRDVLGILRDGPGDSAPERPQPSAADLPDLLAEARASGMRIDVEEMTDLDGVPDALGRTLYRVVQESLTNARKHASDTRIVLTVTGGRGDGLFVTVCNPLRVGSLGRVAPKSGLGLIGLAERTALVGGRLTHRVSPDREFVVEAWLPWPA